MLHGPCCSGELRDIVSVSKYDVDVEVGYIPNIYIYIYVSHVALTVVNAILSLLRTCVYFTPCYILHGRLR